MIGLGRVEEPQAHRPENLAEIWQVLTLMNQPKERDRTIVALLGHGLRASD